MIALKILGTIGLLLLVSFWLTIIISVGVSSGLKSYFEGKKK